MFEQKNFKESLYLVSVENFESAALEIFTHQWNENKIYQDYCRYRNKTPLNTKRLGDIPFLPISFFKSHVIKAGNWQEEKVYLSSGTTTDIRSRHFIKYDQDYLDLAKKTFEDNFGSLNNYSLYALLPSYIEQGDSSLISMVDYFMRFSKPDSRYFLNNKEDLHDQLISKKNEPICLFGVTYALVDFVEKNEHNLPNTIIIETGGMKGRRKEIIRKDLHQHINKKLCPKSIHSEYGMTELTSQAYSNGEKFKWPNWAQVLIRDINDPYHYLNDGETGGINIIDLGNIHSCAFIETMDLGKKDQNGQFEVIGRYDNSDIRGCNLMVT